MRFTRKLLCAAVAAFWSTGALADSGPTWTGLYAGVQAGINSNSAEFRCVDGPCDFGPFDASLTSTLVGGYAGYNYEFVDSSIVLGVEGDLDGSFGKTSFENEEWDAVDNGYRISSSFYGSIRGRAGVLLKDNLLAFVTAGWAFTNYKLDNPGCPDCSAWDSTTIIKGERSGFVIGGGLEYALDEDVHLKLQYLHSEFGKKTSAYAVEEDSESGFVSFPSTLHSDQVDLGISWAFGG